MTKSKITAAALDALTLAGSLAITSGSAQAHSHWGHRRRHRFCGRRTDRRCRRFERLCHSRIRVASSSVMTVAATCA